MKIAKSSEIRASRAFRRKMIKISLSRESDENSSNFEEAYCFGRIVGLKFRAEANVTSNLWAKKSLQHFAKSLFTEEMLRLRMRLVWRTQSLN